MIEGSQLNVMIVLFSLGIRYISPMLRNIMMESIPENRKAVPHKLRLGMENRPLQTIGKFITGASLPGGVTAGGASSETDEDAQCVCSVPLQCQPITEHGDSCC